MSDDTKAQEARDAVSAASKGELATTGAKGLRELIDLQTAEVAKALPGEMDAVRYVRTIHTLVRQTPKLLECSPASVFGAMLSAASLGLEFGPMQQAYMVPYNREATLIIGYRGWATLAHRTGQIQSITPRTIFAKDKWSIEYGLDETLKHEPVLSDDRGAATHYYVVVRTINGGRNFVVMSKSEVEHHRDRYGKKNGKLQGPWADKDQFEAMAWKTAFLRMKAWLPTSVELMQAEGVDGHVVRQMSTDEEPDIEPFDESLLDDEVVDAEIIEETPEERAQREEDDAWRKQAEGH
jgi:recombination protein RecT